MSKKIVNLKNENSNYIIFFKLLENNKPFFFGFWDIINLKNSNSLIVVMNYIYNNTKLLNSNFIL